MYPFNTVYYGVYCSNMHLGNNDLLVVRDLTMILLSFAGFLRFDEVSSLLCSDVKIECELPDNSTYLINIENGQAIVSPLAIKTSFPLRYWSVLLLRIKRNKYSHSIFTLLHKSEQFRYQ
jgi:hypothetical protein